MTKHSRRSVFIAFLFSITLASLAGCSATPTAPAPSADQTVLTTPSGTTDQAKQAARQAVDNAKRVEQQTVDRYCAQPYQNRLAQHQLLMTAAAVGVAAAGAPPIAGQAINTLPPLVLCPGDPGYIPP